MGRMSVKSGIVNKKRTICEVHREIHDVILDSNINDDYANKIINLLEEAFLMGKKMDAKLRQYKNNWDADWWEKNKNFEISFKRRKGE